MDGLRSSDTPGSADGPEGPGSVTRLMQDGLAEGASADAYWELYTRLGVENEQRQRRIGKLLPHDRAAEPVDLIGDAFEKVWDRKRHPVFYPKSLSRKMSLTLRPDAAKYRRQSNLCRYVTPP